VGAGGGAHPKVSAAARVPAATGRIEATLFMSRNLWFVDGRMITPNLMGFAQSNRCDWVLDSGISRSTRDDRNNRQFCHQRARKRATFPFDMEVVA
jgi:hypothetical protein